MHLHTRIMKKIITLAIMATLTLNVSAADEDKKPAKKGTNNKSAIAKFLPELKLTNEQKPKFAALQKEMREFYASQKKKSAAEKKTAANAFHKKRRASLKELFTEAQWAKWTDFQKKRSAERKKNNK